ncbi:hypothetical protein EAF00_011991 [Botryotinia globosa]|nr:hypothetical protein EAF00_011991 [Botryotinia globosa]
MGGSGRKGKERKGKETSAWKDENGMGWKIRDVLSIDIMEMWMGIDRFIEFEGVVDMDGY